MQSHYTVIFLGGLGAFAIIKNLKRMVSMAMLIDSGAGLDGLPKLVEGSYDSKTPPSTTTCSPVI